MERKKVAKLAGFTGALCTTVALAGITIASTGAYFTDSHDGTINTGTGTVKVNTSSTTLNFDNLLPGESKDQKVDYQAVGTGKQDLWLVFPTDGSAEAIIGKPAAGPNPLGRYGHLSVTSTAGAYFRSSNLSVDPNGYNTSQSCYIDPNGNGGSDQEAKNEADKTVPYCAPRPAILLQQNMNYGDSGSVNISFGFTKILKSNAGAPTAQLAKFKIVATQHGVNPLDENN